MPLWLQSCVDRKAQAAAFTTRQRLSKKNSQPAQLGAEPLPFSTVNSLASTIMNKNIIASAIALTAIATGAVSAQAQVNAQTFSTAKTTVSEAAPTTSGYGLALSQAEPSTLLMKQSYDSYGAIAYSPSTGYYGASWGYDAQGSAEDRALYECGQTDCQVMWFRNAYGALAVGYDSWGASWGATASEAQQSALSICRDYAYQYSGDANSCSIEFSRESW